MDRDIFNLISGLPMWTAPTVTSQEHQNVHLWQVGTIQTKASSEKIVSETLNLGT